MGDSSHERRAVGSGSTPPAGSQLGQAFGNYTFFNIIAEGGMGVILAAEHRMIGRRCALKIVSPKYAAREGYSPALVDHFMREARVLGSIDHPNVISLYDAGVVGQCPFMAMRLVGGGDLGSLVAKQGPLTEEQALNLMRDCAAGLKAIHQAGWVNRDLKPANILLEADLSPRISDFGLAVRRGERPPEASVAGTPAYVAPEQVTGGQLDERTDLYALGATIWYALAGRPPFAAATPEETVLQIRAALSPPQLESARPGVSQNLALILEKAMQPLPDRRYKDATEIEHDCQCMLNGEEPEYALIGVKSKRRKSFLGGLLGSQ